jgi:short-subunit dehydrogenase
VNLHDKVIVITGASSGFGEQIARRCAQQGARLVLAARTPGPLEQLAGELGARTGRALAVPTDVADDSAVQRLAQATYAHFGRADVLVANAGFGLLDPLAQARLADLQEMIDVNVYGTVRCIQAFLPAMLRSRSGQIVVMASLAGLIATQGMGFYNTSKHALVGMARTLLLELYGTGVRCALVCPGVANTGFQRRADAAMYARSTRLVTCTSTQVADATVRAIQRRTHGEVIVPRRARVLTTLSLPVPGLSRLVLRLLG